MSDKKRILVEPKRGILRTLTRAEVASLQEAGHNGVHELFRQCCIAVLNTGLAMDDSKKILERYTEFDVGILVTSRGVSLELHNVPYNENVFVDGELNQGTEEHLFSVLRDIVFFRSEVQRTAAYDLESSQGITDAVFAIFRNANLIDVNRPPAMVVNWGGHSITREEYEYSKMVGYHLGLRGCDIGTGCGPGAMKGPMKGAALGHLKQRVGNGMYLGLTEPGIITAESPNPSVNSLVIFPDIEKRLEGFVRRGHGIIVYPGGVGTAEEILYLLGILMHPENSEIPFPLIFTAEEKYRNYFDLIHRFIARTLGQEVCEKYEIVIGNPAEVARRMKRGIQVVEEFRRANDDHPHFNGLLHIDTAFQHPFAPTHENVSKLDLSMDQPKHMLAANLRRMFSALVAGNVKAEGIKEIDEHGPYEIRAPRALMDDLDELLRTFVEQGRMKINRDEYRPCYRLVGE
ncbi:nucleotide 5'-monophosphate nucleosidase PpnN [Telmatospirillum sp. J64-1]|uniref:nucleotide 5'-monophosphate nucleosidase PpnN n=1 Tax=Telmatospirillum sp. J64-1 TaxID=2502183 RepID=UPI00115E9F10|nr:nucleotide 5'-monophosphate nucleosidase PpnN [Telmatospirillum sp. J64-1]